MSKIKLTKGELKRQRDALKQFRRYLPTLLLKKQQLQMKILEGRKDLDRQQERVAGQAERIESWAGLLSDPGVSLEEWVKPVKVETSTTNIAGATVPVFERVLFPSAEYSLRQTPFWTDRGLEALRLFQTAKEEARVIEQRIAILERELRITTQRVNLFEKVKIPECQENIRRIRIYLGDQQANAVGVSKVAKKKVEARNQEAAAV